MTHVYQRAVGGAGGCYVWDDGDIVSLSGVRHARLRIPVRILFINERCARPTGRNFGGMYRISVLCVQSKILGVGNIPRQVMQLSFASFMLGKHIHESSRSLSL